MFEVEVVTSDEVVSCFLVFLFEDDELGELVDACMDESMDIFEDTNDTRKETMKVAHRKVVNDLREADKKLANENNEEYYPDPETAKNGPHQQAYVDTFLDDIHYTRYIDGDLEGVQSINVDGYDIQPKDFRGWHENVDEEVNRLKFMI